MDLSPHRRVRRARAAERGVSLIEGMTASLILLLGLVGVLQGIIVASQQNSLANRATHGSGITSQVRGALEALGRARVVGPDGNAGLFTTGRCANSSAALLELAGGLEDIEPTNTETWTRRCVLDLDAYEDDVSVPATDKLVPGYLPLDRQFFRRVLVLFRVVDSTTNTQFHQVGIVVSWNELGQRRFVRQFVGFYDPGATQGNATNTEI